MCWYPLFQAPDGSSLVQLEPIAWQLAHTFWPQSTMWPCQCLAEHAAGGVPAADQLLSHQVLVPVLLGGPEVLGITHEGGIAQLDLLVATNDRSLTASQLIQVCAWRIGFSHSKATFTCTLSALP